MDCTIRREEKVFLRLNLLLLFCFVQRKTNQTFGRELNTKNPLQLPHKALIDVILPKSAIKKLFDWKQQY